MREGWRQVAVGDIATVVGGGTPRSTEPSYWGGEIPWLTPKDLSERPSRWTSNGSRSITHEGLKNSGARLLPAGSVLLTSRAPVGYVTVSSSPLATNQGFKSLILAEGQLPEFWYYLLAHSTDYLRANSGGSTFQELSGAALKALRFTIPPLAEQRRIVDLIGAVDDAIEKAEAAYRTAQLLRASSLHRMELLSAGGGMSTLGDVLAMGGGSIQTGPFGTLLKAAEYVAEGVPVISTGEVRAGELVLKEGTPRVGRAVLSRLPQYVLREGDIVFARKGAIDRSAPVRAHEDGYFLGSDGIRVRVGEGPSLPAFVALQLQTCSALRWIELNATGTIMKGLNQRVLSSIPLGLLPRERQLEFVEEVSAIDTVRRSASDSSNLLRALRANLLTALLSGEHEIPESYDELMESIP